MGKPKLRVLIADDGHLFAESLRRVLTQIADGRIEICAVAENGNEAVEMAREQRPHVVLMDIRMPGMDGIEATRQITRMEPAPVVLILTNFDDDEYVADAVRSGAAGYLLKDISPDRLAKAIENVDNRSVLFTSAVATKLVDSRSTRVDSTVLPAWYHELTRREREIVASMRKGYTNKEIAVVHNIAEQTVRNHVSDIYFKAGIHDRMKLIEIIRNTTID